MTDIPAVHEYSDAWRWPDGVERFIRDEIPDDARVLNCPAGNSRLGDVLIDAKPQSDDVDEGDMFDLSDWECAFDVAVSDPPWKSMNYFDRHSQFYEIVRTVKPGGWIIYNSTWEPHSNQCEVVGRYRRSDAPFRQISQITVFRRYPGQTALGEWDE